MKKVLTLALAMMLLSACATETTTEATEAPVATEAVETTEAVTEATEAATEATEESTEATAEGEALVTVDQLPYTIELQEPDSAGVVYGVGTYTNNSEHTVTGFELVTLIPSTNEKTYYLAYDSVLPGETSPNFESFGEEGMEHLELSYTVVDDNGTEHYITYNYKTDSYESLELID